MKRFMIGLLCTVPIAAGEFTNGYRDSQGYEYRDGYWYKGEQAYTRTLTTRRVFVPTGTICRNGCEYRTGYYQQEVSYVYEAYQVPAKAQEAEPNEEWRRDLLAIAKKRDEYEAAWRKSEQEQKEFLEATESLGLTGNFRWQNYGVRHGYASNLRVQPQLSATQMQYALQGYHNTYETPVAPQGSTLYRYSDYASPLAAVDLSVHLNQIDRLTATAQNLAGDAFSGFSDLVRDTGAEQAELAKIQVKAQAAAAVLKALGADTARETKSGFRLTPAAPVPVPSPAPEPSPPAAGAFRPESVFSVLAANCQSCHSGDKPKAGFDVREFYNSDDELLAKVEAAITSDQPGIQMPPADSGKVLSAADRELLLQAIRFARK